ncbi:MAG: FISUMP domain-containing protein [Bacteroidota bacterium]
MKTQYKFLILSIILILSIGCKKEPNADFTVSQSNVRIFETINLTNTTTDGYSYLWDLGDGTTSDNKDFSYFYTSVGNYTIKLYAYSENCKKENIAEKDITVTGNETEILLDTRDNQSYITVKIGNQWWMAENLNYQPSSGSYYMLTNSTIYTHGYLYDWITACDVCPDGWHLPNDSNWYELVNYLGGDSIAAGKMKEEGTIHWWDPNTGATNESGFFALPIGHFYNHYDNYGRAAQFWSSSESSSPSARMWSLLYDNIEVFSGTTTKDVMISVRCIKN